MKTKYVILILVFWGFVACNNEDDTLSDPYIEETSGSSQPANITSGTANFSNFVAVGNSLTAGFSDTALFIEGQNKSFPNILAQQFALAGGGTFNQPLMSDNLGGLLLNGTVIAGNRLYLDIKNNPPTPKPVSGTPTTEVSEVLSGPFNNMGVPGAKSFHLLANGYGNLAGILSGKANPYFVRMASNPNASVIEDAKKQNPTFFSLWIGNNDILSYAVSGGTGVDHNQTGNINPATYGNNDITNANVFNQVYNLLLQQLKTNDNSGIIANIPNVTAVPYFTTVPYNPIPMDAQTAAFVNQAYAEYNGGLLQAESMGAISADERERRTIVFTASTSNPVVIEDEYLTDLSNFGIPSYRQATDKDLIVLPARTFIGTLANPNDPTSVNGVGVPLEDNWVLAPEEQTEIANATTTFNNIIKNLAEQYSVIYFDANTLLNQVSTTGYTTSNGIVVTGQYAVGGAFSLDGVHPSPRGYAIIANEMIKVINEKQGSNLPLVDPINYTGVYIN